ncbi:MAG: flippase [Candidatus Paceibacterota bacterium]
MIQKISYNFGIAVLSRLAVGIISLVVVGVLTRSLGPTGFGYYNSIFAYLYIFTAIADLGLYTVLVREVSRVGPDKESIISSKIFTLRLLAVISVVVVADLLVFFMPYTLSVKLGVLIASLFTIFSSLSQVLTGIFQKHLRLYFISISDIIARLVQLALLLIIFKMGASLLLFVWAVVITEVVHFFLIYRFSKPLTKVKLMIDVSYWKEVVKIAFPIAASLIFVLIYFRLDLLLLSIMKPAYDVGVYAVPYKMLEAVIFLPAAFIGLMMPLLSRHAFENKEKFIKVFRRAFNVLAVMALPMTAYIFLLSDKLVGLVGGAGFIESGPVLQILSIAVFVIFFGNLGGNSIVALNIQKKGMWVYLAGAIFNAGLNIILIPKYTYFAAAWTTVVTEILITIWMFWLIKKESAASAELGVFFRAMLATLVMAAIVYPLRGNFVLASVATLSYVPALFLFRGFSTKELRDIVSLKKPESPSDIPTKTEVE